MPQQQRWLTKKGGYLLYLTQFNQSLGAELLTNGDFSTAALAGWTLLHSPPDYEVTEVGAANTHGGGGAGAMNLYSSATANQPRATQNVMSSGAYYYLIFSITARAAGNFAVTNNGNSQNNYAITTVGQRQMGRASSPTFSIQATSGAPHDLTVDDLSLKRLTLNTQVDVASDGTFEVGLPAAASFTPFGGMEFCLHYRLSGGAGAEYNNGWVLYLRRNQGNTAWDVRADSFSGASRVNRMNASSIAYPDALRVKASGDDHNFYTVSGGAPTQRGTTVNSNLFNTARGVNVVYAPEIVPQYLSVA